MVGMLLMGQCEELIAAKKGGTATGSGKCGQE